MVQPQAKITEALSLLGVKRLALAIHDPSFPSLPQEETGRGSPYSEGGRRFIEFISGLGFNALQLGPQGKTTLSNPSPYDGTLFSRSELSISLYALAHHPDWGQLLSPDVVANIARGVPHAQRWRDRQQYTYAWNEQHKALQQAFRNFIHRKEELKQLTLAYVLFTKTNSYWLDGDALYEALVEEYQNDDWRTWSELDQNLLLEATNDQDRRLKQERIQQLKASHERTIEFYRFCQFVLFKQHKQFRELAGEVGLKLFADLQIGFAPRDVWALRDLFLPNYRLGAPPSRTNPDGQPWGYPVLNPSMYYDDDQPGPVLRWMNRRIEKIIHDFDGVRIDHPHGLICPWVYDSTDSDALHAVQNGARLFDSPNLPDHPVLSQFAIVSPDELNANLPRYADGWVRELTEAQVARYGVLIETVKHRLAETGMDASHIVCEVLSSCPHPLKAVLTKNELGRFRVTQKAKPSDPQDVYRSDRAVAEDWIMVGTHDTPPLWCVVESWDGNLRREWANYLAHRLQPESEAQAQLAEELNSSNQRLVEAMFADLFVGPAQNISIFFADLFGVKETYNEPGVVGERNWVLGVPPNYEKEYPERAKQGIALNLPRVLAMALRARAGSNPDALALANQLDGCTHRSCEKSSVEK